MSDKLIALISEHLGLSPSTLTLDADLVRDLNVDSLDVVEMSLRIEEEFNLDIPEDDYAELTTIRAAATYLERRLAGQ